MRHRQAGPGRYNDDACLGELTGLGAGVKAWVAQATPEHGTPPVSDLPERVEVPEATCRADATARSTAGRRTPGAGPLTARIRAPHAPATGSLAELVIVAAEIPSNGAAPSARRDDPTRQSTILTPSVVTPPALASPGRRRLQQVARNRRFDARQLGLFWQPRRSLHAIASPPPTPLNFKVPPHPRGAVHACLIAASRSLPLGHLPAAELESAQGGLGV